MSDYDVIVVGAGNAAFCAALAAQEQGATVLMLEAAPEDERGGNSRFTAGAIRFVYDGVDDIRTLIPDLTPRPRSPTTDFGTYTAGPVLRRHGPASRSTAPIPTWSSSWSPRASTRWLAAREGRALHPDLRPAGVQDRRQVQVLGRADGRGGRRRAGPGRHARPRRRRSAASTSATRTRALDLLYDGDRVDGVRVRHDGEVSELRGQVGGARLRRLRGQSRMAHALSRPGLGARQGARHALQHRRRHPHGARHRRRARAATGRAATPCSGR